MEMSSASPMEVSLRVPVIAAAGAACDDAIPVSDREPSRSRVIMELADGRLTVAAAAELMGLGRRQVLRLRRAFVTAGPSCLISRKRLRPSNRRHGAGFRRTGPRSVRER